MNGETNGKGRSEKAFRAWNGDDLESIAPPRPAPAEPVSWFQRIAPRLPETAPVAPVEPIAPQNLDGTAQTTTYAFADVQAVARAERLKTAQPLAEPDDLRFLREQVKTQAETLLAAAREQARKMGERAEAEGYKAGHAKGYAAGESDARRAVAQQYADERELWRSDLAAFVAHIEAERQQVWADMEPQIVSLVFALAKKVIKQEVEANRDVALAVVSHAIRRVAEGGSLRVRVSPTDLETVRARRDDLLHLVDGLRHVEILDDRRVGPGGCVVETDAGTIDARIETQTDEIGKMLDLPQT